MNAGSGIWAAAPLPQPSREDDSLSPAPPDDSAFGPASRSSSVREISSVGGSVASEEEEGFVAGMFFGRQESEQDDSGLESESEQARFSAGSVPNSSEEEESSDSDGPLGRLKNTVDNLGGGHCCGALCGCSCCILLIALILGSLAGIEATQYGLKRNALTAVVDYDHVYQGGRHFIGFYNNFITFPSTIQTIEWNGNLPAVESTRDEAPMQMRTQSGIMVDLSIAIQYRIVRDTLADMYTDYKLAVEQNFVSMLRSGISDLVQNHPTSDLWVHRQTMQRLLFEKCQEVCASPNAGMKGYVTCWNLQLHGVTIPENVENSVIQKQVQEQNANLEQNRQRAALTRAETTVRLAEYERSIGIVRANASASAYQITQAELSRQLFAWRQAKATAISVTHGEIPALTNDQLVRYFELKSAIDSVNSTLAYGDVTVAWF